MNHGIIYPILVWSICGLFLFWTILSDDLRDRRIKKRAEEDRRIREIVDSVLRERELAKPRRKR